MLLVYLFNMKAESLDLFTERGDVLVSYPCFTDTICKKTLL